MNNTPRAALVLIGNEILSGKVQDLNAQHLIRRLREWGVDLARIAIVQDQIDVIAEEVRTDKDRFDFVLTSGGIGPTHDDVTYDAIAKAFDVPLELNRDVEECIKKSRNAVTLNPEVLRMAMLPQGSTLLPPDIGFPTTKIGNVYILPGVPELFRVKVDAMRPILQGTPFHLCILYLDSDEGSIAELLGRTEREFGIQIGSYPLFQKNAEYRLRITLESKESEPVEAAADALCTALGSKLIRRESL